MAIGAMEPHDRIPDGSIEQTRWFPTSEYWIRDGMDGHRVPHTILKTPHVLRKLWVVLKLGRHWEPATWPEVGDRRGCNPPSSIIMSLDPMLSGHSQVLITGNVNRVSLGQLLDDEPASTLRPAVSIKVQFHDIVRRVLSRL